MTSYPGYDTTYQQAASQPTYNGTPTAGYAQHPPQPNYYGSNHPYMPSPSQQPYWAQKK